MKLVTFTAGGGAPRVGAMNGDDTRVVDLAAADNQPYFATMLDVIEAGDTAVGRAKDIVATANDSASLALADVSLKSPILVPPQLRDFLCFEEHLINAFAMLRKKKADAEPDPVEALKRYEEEGAFAPPPIWYDQPLYYKPSRFGVIGTDEDTVWPFFSELMDYEMEFGCWLGKSGKDVTPEQAKDLIFGYSIFNDMSARDTQAREMPAGFGPGKGKDFETGQIIGPCIVTADAFDPYNAEMIVRINGEEVSRGHSGKMYWKFEDCIAHVSRAETVHPGEFFASGTVGGGCGLEHDRFLTPNDVIELEVTGIGVLRNRIVRPD
jgi:2-keto-4-pentenoate hydratase/2-oxohepta-3-ene-1,7-dioic acid hydratase in catechol pathway